MHPVRRLVRYFYLSSKAGHQEARDHDDEEGGPVPLLMLFERKMAYFAALRHCEQAAEEPALPAGGAALEEGDGEERGHGEKGL